MTFMPFCGVREMHDVDVIGNVIPGFLWTNSHDGKKIEAALESGDRVVRNGGGHGRELGFVCAFNGYA
jgi:hypothetical protein